MTNTFNGSPSMVAPGPWLSDWPLDSSAGASGSLSAGPSGPSGLQAPSRPGTIITNGVIAQAGLPTDVHAQSYVNGLVRKAQYIINLFIRLTSEKDPHVLLDRASGQVHVDVAQVRLAQVVETNSLATEEIQKYVNQFLEECYSPFVHDTVSVACHAWMWMLYGHALRATLSLILVWTRMRLERAANLGQERAREPLSLALLLFLSDTRVYDVQQRATLRSRLDELRAGIQEQGKTLLETFFFFPLKK